MLSPAKINLGLKVLFKRPDGYHEINSYFIKLNWGDDIEIQPNHSNDLILISKNELIKGKAKLYEEVSENGDITKNIIYKTYYYIKSICPNIPGITVKLTKRIPPGGGLGGGSTNAASIFHFFISNSFLNLDDDLIQKSSKIGADIPFFLKGGNYFISGIGEKLEIAKVGKGTGILAIPEYSIDTKLAYSLLNKPLQKRHSLKQWKFLPDNLISKLEAGIWSDLREHMTNDFEVVAFFKYPELEKLKKEFYKIGCSFVSMTGTGSCIYGLVEERKQESVYSEISTLYPDYTFIRFNF